MIHKGTSNIYIYILWTHESCFTFSCKDDIAFAANFMFQENNFVRTNHKHQSKALTDKVSKKTKLE